MTVVEKVNYIQNGDYLIPDLQMEDLDNLPDTVGKYGMMRETHLKENRRGTYGRMLQDGSLWPHLVEVDRTAHSQVDQMTEEMMKAQGVTEALKAKDQLLWVQMATNIKLQAEEVVMKDLIYAR
ncbi:MAG: TnpV protein [Clostridia bacterium]|nr:TnpV protein [Clostridia bacterium]